MGKVEPIDKIISIILVAVVAVAIGTLGYAIATSKGGEKFTEFYILGLSGQALDYPKELKIGEESKVIVGIINHEGEVVNYNIEVVIDGVKQGEEKTVVLEHEEEWEGEVTFTPGVAGDNQKVEFLLRKNGDAEPFLEPLHLWIDVSEAQD